MSAPNNEQSQSSMPTQGQTPEQQQQPTQAPATEGGEMVVEVEVINPTTIDGIEPSSSYSMNVDEPDTAAAPTPAELALQSVGPDFVPSAVTTAIDSQAPGAEPAAAAEPVAAAPPVPEVPAPSVSVPEVPKEPFVVKVKTLTGKVLSVDINALDVAEPTVSDLKKGVQNIDGLHPDQQRLIFQGRQLEDSAPLTGDGNGRGKIEHNSEVHLVVALRGGRR